MAPLTENHLLITAFNNQFFSKKKVGYEKSIIPHEFSYLLKMMSKNIYLWLGYDHTEKNLNLIMTCGKRISEGPSFD